jgi:hypothetical protein
MQRRQIRNRLAAAVLATVALLTVPASALTGARTTNEGGWLGWFWQGWTHIVAVALGGGMNADPNGGDSPGSTQTVPGVQAGQSADGPDTPVGG